MDIGLLPSRTKILLIGWPADVTEDDVRDALASYGELADVFIPVDGPTQRAKRAGWVSFQYADDAKALMESGEELRILGQKVKLEWWSKREVSA